MFIGHYALGFGAKKIDDGPSLGTLFLAVQWLDLIWPILVLVGVEKFTIEPGNTVITPLHFVYYPWSHSMLMALVWGVLFGLIFYFNSRNQRPAILLSLLVFSHWILDWITHGPDLQWTPFGEARTGLGLWNYKWPEIILESMMFVLGVIIYMKATKAKSKTGIFALWGFLIFLLGIHFMNIFGDPPKNVQSVGWMALSQWLLVAWGYWIDKNRQ